MTRSGHPASRTILAVTLGATLAAGVAACSGASSSSKPTGTFTAAPSDVHPPAPSSPPVPAATATTAGSAASTPAGGKVSASWTRFFGTGTSDSERVALLQDGSRFSAAVSSLSASLLGSGVSSKVDTVKLSSGTRANVTYDLTADGAEVEQGAKGTSVLQDGTWKVSDSTFCGLLSTAKSMKISVSIPAACKTA